MTEARKPLRGQVSLRGRCRLKVDALVCELAYVDCNRGKYISVCTDILFCAGYVGGKRMSVSTVLLVQTTTEKGKCLLGRVSLCHL